jgi:hypothetical protein
MRSIHLIYARGRRGRRSACFDGRASIASKWVITFPGSECSVRLVEITRAGRSLSFSKSFRLLTGNGLAPIAAKSMPKFVGNHEFAKFGTLQMPSSIELFVAPCDVRHERLFNECLSFRGVCKCRAVGVESSWLYYGLPVFGAHQNPSPFSNFCSEILRKGLSKNGYILVTAFYGVICAADKVLRRALVLEWVGDSRVRYLSRAGTYGCFRRCILRFCHRNTCQEY